MSRVSAGQGHSLPHGFGQRPTIEDGVHHPREISRVRVVKENNEHASAAVDSFGSARCATITVPSLQITPTSRQIMVVSYQSLHYRPCVRPLGLTAAEQYGIYRSAFSVTFRIVHPRITVLASPRAWRSAGAPGWRPPRGSAGRHLLSFGSGDKSFALGLLARELTFPSLVESR
jgi:hypothetical protein